MTRIGQLVVITTLTIAAAGRIPAQGGVVVVGFETDGSVGLTRADYDAMGRALTVLLTSELGQHSSATVTDLKVPGVTRAGRVDLTKARAAAAQMGAKYLIVGSLLDQYGDLRVEARLLNATSGDPVAVIRADAGHGKRELVSESLGDVVAGLGGRTELGGPKPAPVRASIPVDALVSFGQGLRFEESGDRAAAAAAYRSALKTAPGLVEATAALRRVGG